MAERDGIIAIDQGTTSSRAIVFELQGKIMATAQQEFPQHYPHSGWVEHDPQDLLDSTINTCRRAIRAAKAAGVHPSTIGITNQRETTVVWDRQTGEPVHNAVVWQDRRTAERCAALKAAGHEALIAERTGLLLDPYFSATKIAWILDNTHGARERANKGELAFGTVDTWLLWKLTGGRSHATDATNASRTLLFDIHRQCWDEELLGLFDIPLALMPEVRDSASAFGTTDADILGVALPVEGIAGDQHAAMVGQCCFRPGMIKSTYGTGCFALMNTGAEAVPSRNRLLTTTAYRINGEPTYALEGAIFIAGAAIQWLRDELGIIAHASQSEGLANDAEAEGLYMVPAFTGLGAPWWDPNARGAIFGLTRNTGVPEFVHAALDSVCLQTGDLLEAMAGDSGAQQETLRVDGGMVANNWLLQRLADLTGLAVERPEIIETTALGAACLAGLQHGHYESLEDLGSQWALNRRFEPAISRSAREHIVEGWHDAVRRTLTT
ncbi:glycerol kinase [Spiribacter salinus M19-40]|jgi:glycerol kinase|uniref:Glycerol kinase n=1 Tax=Spiribacter salinus M19-40 TaxID=1260251 RepID=R4VHN2_9GAMM|nr:glycerol kinase GlpK [Spiribacter salinus]AGM41681.1 glycerol kinase [Spiribacter salinus M19-40]MBY5268768.1 glycerol kinase [Spiribacter salinus]